MSVLKYLLELAAILVPLIIEALEGRNEKQATNDEFEEALARGDTDRLGALLSQRFDGVRHQ